MHIDTDNDLNFAMLNFKERYWNILKPTENQNLHANQNSIS